VSRPCSWAFSCPCTPAAKPFTRDGASSIGPGCLERSGSYSICKASFENPAKALDGASGVGVSAGYAIGATQHDHERLDDQITAAGPHALSVAISKDKKVISAVQPTISY
jgi:hypothetical protein